MRRTEGGEGFLAGSTETAATAVWLTARPWATARGAGVGARVALSGTAGALACSADARQQSLLAALSPAFAQQSWLASAAFMSIGQGHTARTTAASDAA